ncbi:MAG: outer membrane protein transport protein [Desulfosalsimonadaceae bacterium]
MARCNRTLPIPFVFIFLMAFSGTAHAVFNEQIAVDARAISLANTCTADPPGLMSVHYNPAGLSLLDEGKTFSNGFVLPIIRRTGKLTADPDFDGFMGDTWGPNAPYNPDDPQSAHGGPDPLDGKEGTNSSQRMYIPFYGPVDMLFGANMGLSSRKPESKWTFAYANYAPYGGGMAHRDPDDPMRFGCKSVYLQHLIYAAPTASYRISERLSAGISVGMGQTALGLELDQRTPNELVAMTRSIGDATKDLEIPVVSEQTLPPPFLGGGLGPYEYNSRLAMDLRDDFTPSVNLGMLWRPKSWFSYGITYQSRTKAQMRGDYTFEYSDQFQRMVNWNGKTSMTLQGAGMLDLPVVGVPYQSGTVYGNQLFPHRIQTGIMVRPAKKVKLMLDLHYAKWSDVSRDYFVFDQDIQLFRLAKLIGYTGGNRALTVKRDMKDTFHWSVGGEYRPIDLLTFRLGYEKRPMSARDNLFDALYFLPDMDFIGTGVGIHLPKKVTVDLAFGYLFNRSYKVPDNTSSNMNSTEFTDIVYNPYTGLDYEQETELYLMSFGVTMPFEVHVEMMNHHKAAIKNIINKINPFHKEKNE